MKSIQLVENLASELMSKHFTIKDIYGNLKTYSAKELGYSFKWDNAKRRSGQINYHKKTISLSKTRVEVNLHQLHGLIKNTILHEIAHAFSYKTYGINGVGHGEMWRSIALQIGCNGQRCTSGYENLQTSKYTFLCKVCGKESQIHRKPRLKRSCGKCSPNVYNVNYLLEVVQNY